MLETIVNAVRDMFVGSLGIAPAEAAWLAIGLIGGGFAMICFGIMWAFMRIGEGGGNLLTSAGTSGETLSEGLATSSKLTAEGVKNALSTGQTLITTAGQVRIADIQARRQAGKVSIEDNRGNKVGVDLTGEGSLDVIANVVDNLGGVTGKVIAPSYVRMITDKTGEGE
jgi:hypothetical protein